MNQNLNTDPLPPGPITQAHVLRGAVEYVTNEGDLSPKLRELLDCLLNDKPYETNSVLVKDERGCLALANQLEVLRFLYYINREANVFHVGQKPNAMGG